MFSVCGAADRKKEETRQASRNLASALEGLLFHSAVR